MELQIEQAPAFHEREWRARRVGWLLMGVFVLAGLIGLLGSGPVSATTTSTGTGRLAVDHRRITHLQSDDSVVLRVGSEAVEGDTLSLDLHGSWPAGVDVRGITPEPTEQRARPDGVVLEFAIDRPGDVEITISFRARRPGPLEATVAAPGEALVFRQFVLP